jgi:hypothetical protein
VLCSVSSSESGWRFTVANDGCLLRLQAWRASALFGLPTSFTAESTEFPGMPASNFAVVMDTVQRGVRSALKAHGFKVRGRTFNRVTADGLTQVINLQMGASDPPGVTRIPGVTNTLHGMFTVNLGVFIPEVAEARLAGARGQSWIQEYSCSIRSRLGVASGHERDMWWPLDDPTTTLAGVEPLLLSFGLLFLDRFRNRELILSELDGFIENLPFCATPLVVSAVILAKKDDPQKARRLMQQHVSHAHHHPSHADYVRKLALDLGLGVL